MEKGFTIIQPPYGYVRYIDHLGSDQRIVEAARVSYQSPLKGDTQDRKLLEYLFKMRHTSPFEQCSITFNIKLPIFAMRQFVRHRTFRLNEWSARYKELPDQTYLPEVWRRQGDKANNAQGSTPDETPQWNHFNNDIAKVAYDSAFQSYQLLLQRGVAKELARIVLPVGIYTTIYVNCDLHNLIHFLRLRLDAHAQLEMQEIAKGMEAIFSELFPWTFRAFQRYSIGMIDNGENITPTGTTVATLQ